MSKCVSSQQWSIEYPTNENETVLFVAGDMSLSYNYVVGTTYIEDSNVSYPIALCIDEKGVYKERILDDVFNNASFMTALGLGDGNVFVAAFCRDDVISDMSEKIWVAIMNPDLDIIAEQCLEIEHPYVSYGESAQALLNDNGEIVFVTKVTDSIPSYNMTEYDFSFYKFDGNCNLLKQSYLLNPSYHSDITDFIAVPNTDCYAMYSNGMSVLGVETVSYIDDELNYLSSSMIDDFDNYPDNILPMFVCVDYWYDENHFLISANSSNTNGINFCHPIVLKMDTDMNIIKTLDLERIDTTDYVSQYRSMAYVNSDRIYVSTYWQNISYFDVYPNTATVFLINDKLDILGRKDFDINEYINIVYIQPTYDEGCIIQTVLEYDDNTQMVIYKLKAEDFEIVTDVIENDDLKERFYPNPVSSVLNINVKDVSGVNARITLIDILGRRYMDKEMFLDGNTLTLDVSVLTKGTYFYNIMIDERCVLRSKFIKE